MAARKASDKALLALAGTLMLSGAVASVFTTAGGGVALADGNDCTGDSADCEVYDVIPLEPDVAEGLEWEEADEPAASQSPSSDVDITDPAEEPEEPEETPNPEQTPKDNPRPNPVATSQQPKPQPTSEPKPTKQRPTKQQPKPQPTTVTKTVVKPEPRKNPVTSTPRKDPVKPTPKPDPKPKPDKDTFTVPAEAATMVNLVNDMRSKRGRPALKLDSCLQTKGAQPWADTIARRNKLAHSGMTWTSKCPNIGAAGEIEGARYSSAEQVFDAWSSSLTYRSTLLKRSYDRAGVGIATSADGTQYWVMTFGQSR